MENSVETVDNLQDTNVQQEQLVIKELKSTWRLIKESISFYFLEFKILTLITLIPFLLAILLKGAEVFSLTSQALSQSVAFSVLKAIIYLTYLYFGSISILAIVYAIKYKIGALEAYLRAIKNSFSYLWVIFLFFLPIIAGTSLIALFAISGFLGSYNREFMNIFYSIDSVRAILLILGAIFYITFFVYFIFSIFSFVFEEKIGMETIWRSKQLVGGNFWRVAWRTLLFFLTLGLLAAPFVVAQQFINDRFQILSELVKLLLIPLAVIFETLLYKNLSEIKEGTIFEKPGRLSKYVYYCLLGAGLPLALIFFGLQILNLTAYDISNPDDSDLQLQTINIPKEQNAYYDFVEVKDVNFMLTGQDAEIDKILLGEAWNESLVNEVLQKNQQALAFFEKGVGRTYFQLPAFQNPTEYESGIISGINFSSLRSLARINSLQALLLLKQGREKEAFDQAMKTMKMAQMILDGQNGLAGYLVGISIKGIGVDSFKILIVNTHLSSSELLSYIEKLSQYEESSLAMQKVMKGEYIMTANTLKKMRDSILGGEKSLNEKMLGAASSNFGESSNLYYQPNRTKLLFMETYRAFIDNAGKDNFSEVSYAKEIPIKPWIIFSNNASGKILTNIIRTSLDSVVVKKFEENFSVKGLQLLLALKAYRQDTGNLPNTLNDLVPNYIPMIGNDPFNGKQIKYSANNKLIYSVGKDLIDDGGEIGEKWNTGSDLVFRIDF